MIKKSENWWVGLRRDLSVQMLLHILNRGVNVKQAKYAFHLIFGLSYLLFDQLFCLYFCDFFQLIETVLLTHSVILLQNFIINPSFFLQLINLLVTSVSHFPLSPIFVVQINKSLQMEYSLNRGCIQVDFIARSDMLFKNRSN